MDDQQFRRLLEYFDLSWAGYRKVRKGVKKRIARHMEGLGCHTMAEYLLTLDGHPGVRLECERLMAVSISRFFRDQSLWQALENKIFPEILKRDVDPVRIWSAGCACGEEVYTLKILWERLRAMQSQMPSLHILATDLNPLYIERAKAGIYPRSSLREVPEEIIPAYFERQRAKDHFAVQAFLKNGITWKEHHFLSDPPEKDFHLILLRNNLLTYYNQEIIDPALERVTTCLTPEGYLIIGIREKIPSPPANLTPLKDHACVFQNRH
ncbi:MAG: hypothetical protein MUO52_13835 [Desulfobacterales bacterium]|nr:hypothetical protein [Desulfobacterales bacterium]